MKKHKISLTQMRDTEVVAQITGAEDMPCAFCVFRCAVYLPVDVSRLAEGPFQYQQKARVTLRDKRTLHQEIF